MIRRVLPFPGSDEALAQGCQCSQMDNRHHDWRFAIINQPCPLHGWEEGTDPFERRNA